MAFLSGISRNTSGTVFYMYMYLELHNAKLSTKSINTGFLIMVIMFIVTISCILKVIVESDLGPGSVSF